jgi:hypothetical protein
VRQKMRRVTLRLIAFLTLGFVTALGFQNCAGYEAANNPLFLATEAVCIGLSCGQNPDLIGININSDGMIYVRTPSGTPTACDDTNGTAYNADSLCFDVAGFCEAGGYPDNRIYVSLMGGTVNQPEYQTDAKCVDGRYRFLYRLPNGYDYANMHRLRVRIVGVDSNLNEVANPSGGNYQEVGISSYTQQ